MRSGVHCRMLRSSKWAHGVQRGATDSSASEVRGAGAALTTPASHSPLPRLTITIAAIMVEVTNDVQVQPSLMLALAIAKVPPPGAISLAMLPIPSRSVRHLMEDSARPYACAQQPLPRQ